MLDKKIKEALELLGGKAVIKDCDECYILLTLDEFRKMRQESVSGLTKEELIDKINSDIASWKFSQEEKKVEALDAEAVLDEKENEVKYEKVSD